MIEGDDDKRRFSPATTRNKGPILDVLRRVLQRKERAKVLEIASGGGEHAVFLAEELAVQSWQPTDPDPEARESIEGWRAHAKSARVRAPIDLDVTKRPWPAKDVDVIVCINMIHISPWEATLALLGGAADVLAPGGILFLYGPYKRNGAHTAPTNEVFEANLRARNASWGVRDLEAVQAEAERVGFSLQELVPMPANNFSVILRRA